MDVDVTLREVRDGGRVLPIFVLVPERGLDRPAAADGHAVGRLPGPQGGGRVRGRRQDGHEHLPPWLSSHAARAAQDQACLRRGVEERPPCSRPRRADPRQAGDPLRRSACPLHRRDLPTDSPDSVLMEGVADAFAEYYSLQLSANIRRGQRYNAERALSNGHKIFGFAVDQDKRYTPDLERAPIVAQIFHDYASGVSMQKICNQLNAQGIRTTRGYRFTPKNLNKMLKNRAYIGAYAYGGHIHEDGMPRLVDDLTFNEVQHRFAINKRSGAKTKAELATQGENAPDYWLTGRAYCLTCGGPMEGVSGTSKTGKTYRYYYCLNQRKKKCSAKTVRKDEIEVRIEEIVASFLTDPEMLASLAVDLADHYQQTHGRGDEILKALEARRADVEKKLANFVKAISQGIFNETTAEAMRSLEEQKRELDAAIQAEHVKATLYEDKASIGTFYKRFAEATTDTPETRDQRRPAFRPLSRRQRHPGIPTRIWPTVVNAHLLVWPGTVCFHAGTLYSGVCRGCSFRGAELRPGHSPTPTILLLAHTWTTRSGA